MEDGDAELIRWGDWGWAARLRLTYTHPRNGIRGTIDELVGILDPHSLAVRRGTRADVLAGGFSGERPAA